MKALLGIILLISLVFASLSIFAFSANKNDKRNYPGGADEGDLQVREKLPSNYKRSRKYYENQIRRDIASTPEEE